MQSLFQKYRHALWFLLFGALSSCFLRRCVPLRCLRSHEPDA